MKYLTPLEAEEYIPLKESFTNDTLQTCVFYTLIPSINPDYPFEDGWETVVYLTNKKKSDFGSIGFNEHDGWIYILSNPMFDKDILKIGYTDNNPYDRSNQISTSTGVIVPFKVEWAIQVRNAKKIESLVHSYLKNERINHNREFFKINKDKAIEIIKNIINDMYK